MTLVNSKTYWSFALINNRLAEIYYEMKLGKPYIFGHYYVKKIEYRTRKEQSYIKNDTKKYRFTWKNNTYKKVK